MPTSSVPTAPPPRARGIRDRFLEVYEQEHSRTLRVLKAFPKDRLDLRPHPKAKTARELAFMFVVEQGMVEKALTTGFDFSKTIVLPNPPESFDAIIEAFEKGHKHVAGLISVQRDEELAETIQFPEGPGKMRDWPRIDFLWFVLHDQIHHRGQFSVYLRMADAKVPAIYGPSLDEQWF